MDARKSYSKLSGKFLIYSIAYSNQTYDYIRSEENIEEARTFPFLKNFNLWKIPAWIILLKMKANRNDWNSFRIWIFATLLNTYSTSKLQKELALNFLIHQRLLNFSSSYQRRSFAYITLYYLTSAIYPNTDIVIVIPRILSPKGVWQVGRGLDHVCRSARRHATLGRAAVRYWSGRHAEGSRSW